MNLQKQHAKIPNKFKVPTHLFTRLDMDIDQIVKLNFKRKEIADMKKIVSEQDALYASAMWNFHRVQYDVGLMEKNKNNQNLKISYIIAGLYQINHLIDSIKVMLVDMNIKS